jgi:H+-transporting ATPase
MMSHPPMGLLVKALQRHGHLVGMCGDGVNDAPALRQAQIGIAVSTATDAAKAAAGMVMTEPGLAGVVFAVREGRVGFQRLLTYTDKLVSRVCRPAAPGHRSSLSCLLKI